MVLKWYKPLTCEDFLLSYGHLQFTPVTSCKSIRQNQNCLTTLLDAVENISRNRRTYYPIPVKKIEMISVVMKHSDQKIFQPNPKLTKALLPD